MINVGLAFDGYAVYANNAEPANPRNPGQSVRVGWVSEAAFGPGDPEISAAVATLLQDLGCDVEGVDLDFMTQNDWLTPFFTLWYGELIPYLRRPPPNSPRRANLLVMLAVIRQLVEAERSPGAGIEDEHHWAL